MMNILDNGKYRQKNEWNNSSIPSLVDIEENNVDDENYCQQKTTINPPPGLPPKPPRRSSLALFAGRGLLSDKSSKRRSSIAVAILGRRDSHKIAKETSSSYESAMKTEKSDGSTLRSPEIIFTSHHNITTNLTDSNTSINENNDKYHQNGFVENNSNIQNIINNNDNSNGEYCSDKDTSGTTKYRRAGRRMSWQTKLERRRRRNFDLANQTFPIDGRRDSNASDIPYKTDENGGEMFFHREKRHSWWNIFVPDQLKNRSRRASQDISFMTRSVDSLAPPNRRSKSRSVDHGLAAPFDLDSLRSKVEGRFESVDRLSKDGDKLKKSSLPSIPTISYTVGNRDTLTSVAARFDTTPSELTHLNRLNSNFIYPGQQLLVPDKSGKDDISISGSTGDEKTSSASGKSSPVERKLSGEISNDEKEILDGLRPGSPKAGHIERISTNLSNTLNKNDGGDPADDPIITQRFLKINVRHITDGQGVVGGVLLVTPNAVMFDPNVSDPLVIEHGPESYGVIAPMELVVNAAIFHDIAHMRVAGTGDSSQTEKVEIYYPKIIQIKSDAPTPPPSATIQQNNNNNRLEGTQSPGKDSLLVKDETFPELGVGSVETCDDQESIASSTGREGDAFPKAFDRDRVTPTPNIEQQNSVEQKQLKDITEAKDSSKTEGSADEKTNDDSDDKKSITNDARTTLEDRRKSLLDHHWAIPSKDRISLTNSRRSSEDEGEPDFKGAPSDEVIAKMEKVIAAALAAAAAEKQKMKNSQNDSSITEINDIVPSLLDEMTSTTSRSNSLSGSFIGGIGGRSGSINSNSIAAVIAAATNNNLFNQNSIDNDNDSQLSKQSNYDSGIDIRDPIIPIVAPMPTKKVFSDADIVLSSDWVPPRTISPTHIVGGESPPRSTSGLSGSILSQTHSLDTGGGGGGRKKTSSVSFSVDDEQQQQQQQQQNILNDKNSEQKKNKMLKRLSYPLTWVEGLTGEGGNSGSKNDSTESAPNTGDSNQSVFSKVFSSSPITLVSELGGNLFSKTPSEDSGGSPVPPVTPHSEGYTTPGRSSIGTFMRPQSSDGSSNSLTKSQKPAPTQPKLDYRSMVSIDDMPELFVSFDKLIPRPARACQDPPLYLRLRMGKPVGKAIPLPTSVMSYGKNKLRPEYWFSVPKNRVDELYRFINTWVPHLYGELDEKQIEIRGFELIQDDTEWSKGSTLKEGRTNSEGEDITELTRESWEVLSMSTEDYRKASLFATGSFDLDFPIPDLIGQTEILTEEHREKLCSHLPARAEGYSWSLVFSTSQHGFSLNSLYRKMQRLESPVLIVIEDTEHNVFGALTSCSLHVSDHFYGTGESLLYKFNPNFKVFHWTGENLYFIKGNPESLSIGAGDGRFGLWLDGDLNQGRSSSCSTYGNEPLAPQEDFVIKTLECWAFV